MVSVKGFFCGAFRKLASAPSPFPSTPWHCAQTRSKTLRPSAAEGIRGRPCSLATIGAASNDTSRSGRMRGATPTVGWQATRTNIPITRRTAAGNLCMRVPIRFPPPAWTSFWPGAKSGCRRAERLQDLAAVPVRADPAEDAGDPSPRIDDEGRPLDAPVGAPGLLLLLPHAGGGGRGLGRVGQQDERQIVLLRELRVRGRTVGADADDYRVPLGVGGGVVAGAARLRGAARGGRLGVGVEEDPLPR